ncbi:hypothetical protein HHI36_001511 [Cryptolaemus montrouzieri]|uniref:Uncharacterized protein n=1 Tax=Cryptolaemus montrouzieri TaxID=559131 RepID=A0ABD2P815_9CUCU
MSASNLRLDPDTLNKEEVEFELSVRCMKHVGTFQELCKSLQDIVKLESEGKPFQFSYSRDSVQELEICKDKLKECWTCKPEEDKQEQLNRKSEALMNTLALSTRLDTLRLTSPCPPEVIMGQNLSTISNTSTAKPLGKVNPPTLNAITANTTIPNSPVAQAANILNNMYLGPTFQFEVLRH